MDVEGQQLVPPEGVYRDAVAGGHPRQQLRKVVAVRTDSAYRHDEVAGGQARALRRAALEHVEQPDAVRGTPGAHAERGARRCGLAGQSGECTALVALVLRVAQVHAQAHRLAPVADGSSSVP